MRHLEKNLYLLAKIGDQLQAQRLTVFRETPEEFAARLTLFGGAATGSTIEAMENGSPSIPIGTWLSAWQAMQVADAVAKAAKSDAALYLASAQADPNIEQEMIRALNSKTRKDQ